MTPTTPMSSMNLARPIAVERAYKRYKLEETLALFQQTHERMGLIILPDSTIGRTYEVRHTELGRMRILVLGRSSEWYSYRLNTYADTIDAVVCATHDSWLPLPVFALDRPQPVTREKTQQQAPTYYKPFQTRIVDWSKIPEHFLHTERGHKMLLGALMCRIPEAEQVLTTFKRSTRYRIESETRTLLLRKRGRPIAGATVPHVPQQQKETS